MTPHVKIADTGLSVSRLGLGTVKFGRNEEVKYPESFEIPDDQQVLALLSQAHDAGINLLDTAPAYGSAQQRLGKLVGNNDDWLICSKVGERFANGISEYVYTEAETRQTVENSLRDLKREALDIVLIHSNGDDLHVLQETPVMETLLRLKQEGKIRAAGVSSKTVAGGLLALQHLDVVMCMYNLLETDELPVILAASESDKGIFIKKGLMSGHLDKASQDNPLLASYRHIFAQPGVSSLIVGTINPQHLQQNIDALNTVLAV
ncbi:MAG: aldo/keto reductase [Gammaproteobacteria bacterium]|nr:aldo/keto reductase [Gammaproteobacteria bacterium]